MNKTVVVGMSGGVDSSVAALLLKQQGYNVIGLFMHNWEENDEDGACTAADDFEDVKRVCEKLQIPYYSVNFAQQYLDKVFADFLEEYKKGRTPNPDVLCNREIKFGPFLEYALMLGADYVATGHYANIRHEDGVHYLQRAIDENKDQTYFLNQLSQQQLERVIFPVGNIEKPELRRIAEENGLITAQKKDSTGVCFIGERKFRQFLQNYLPAKSGNIVDTQGRVVGKHEGVMFYTYGQRRGLHIGGMSGSNGGRWFVYDKDVKNNILYVSQGDESVLYSSGLVSYKVNWIPHTPQTKTFECLARFRHRQPLQKVTVTLHEDKVEVKFAQKQRAITPGQYVVFYNERDCLGGGIIEEVIK